MKQITIVPLYTLVEWEQFMLPPTTPLATWRDWDKYYHVHSNVIYTLTTHYKEFSRVFCPDYTCNDPDILAYSDMSPDMPVIRAPKPVEHSPWVAAWLRRGLQNYKLKRARLPQFTAMNFITCADVDRLKRYLTEAEWGLGQAFYVGDICLISVQEGGDRWLVMRRDVAFETICSHYFVASNTFDDFWQRISRATDEQLINLAY